MFTTLRLCVLSLLVFLLIVNVTLSQLRGRARDTYPNPTIHRGACGRDPRTASYICDPDNLLQKDEANQLDVVIQSIRNETKCPCSSYSCQGHPSGYKVGIALMNKMEIDSSKIDSENDDNDDDEANNERKKNVLALDEAKLFAHELHKNWKLGYCDEDVIILYSHTDSVVYTVTGSVARAKLDDKRVGSIAMSARRTNFPQSIFNGLLNIVQTYRAVLLDQAVAEPSYGESKSESSSFPKLNFFFLLACVFIALFTTSRSDLL